MKSMLWSLSSETYSDPPTHFKSKLDLLKKSCRLSIHKKEVSCRFSPNWLHDWEKELVPSYISITCEEQPPILCGLTSTPSIMYNSLLHSLHQSSIKPVEHRQIKLNKTEQNYPTKLKRNLLVGECNKLGLHSWLAAHLGECASVSIPHRVTSVLLLSAWRSLCAFCVQYRLYILI